MQSHILLDVREDSFQGIGSVGNVEVRIAEVSEEVGKIPIHTVVGTPNSAMGVVPSLRELIDGFLFEKHSPLVVPEFQPERELRFSDMWEVSQQCLQILSRFELWATRHITCDDGSLVEMTHLHGHGKALQDATSAVTDNCLYLPSDCFQRFDSILVCCDGFVREELPQKVLLTMRAAPNHDSEETLEVRRIHDDDHFIGCQFFLLNLNVLQLSLYPLRAASILLRNLRVSLFAMGEFVPDFLPPRWRLLPALFTACTALPELLSVPRSVLLERG